MPKALPRATSSSKGHKAKDAEKAKGKVKDTDRRSQDRGGGGTGGGTSSGSGAAPPSVRFVSGGTLPGGPPPAAAATAAAAAMEADEEDEAGDGRRKRSREDARPPRAAGAAPSTPRGEDVLRSSGTASANDGGRVDAKLLEMLLKQTLVNAQQGRLVTSIVSLTYMGPSDSDLIREMKGALTVYGELVRGQRGHEHGSPSVHAFGALLRTMKDAPGIDSPLRAELTRMATTWDEMTVEDSMQLLKGCSFTKCYRPEDTRIKLSYGLYDDRSRPWEVCITRGLKQLGWKLLAGTAPPGHMERSIQQALDRPPAGGGGRNRR